MEVGGPGALGHGDCCCYILSLVAIMSVGVLPCHMCTFCADLIQDIGRSVRKSPASSKIANNDAASSTAAAPSQSSPADAAIGEAEMASRKAELDAWGEKQFRMKSKRSASPSGLAEAAPDNKKDSFFNDVVYAVNHQNYV